MFRQLILATALLTLVSGLYAQKPDHDQRPPRIDREITRMDAALDLTADQEKKIRGIMEHSRKEMEKDREANRDNRDAMRRALEARRELTDMQIRNILTDAQRDKYDDYQKTRASQAQAEEMKEQLNLSDEQTVKIAAILQERNEKMKTMRNQIDEDREANMEQMRSMMKEYNIKITSELNEEQKQRYEELAKERRGRGQRSGQNRF